MKPVPILIAGLAVLVAATARAADVAAPSPQAVEFFEKHVRPILAEHCFSCHGPEKQKSGLRLDTEAFVLKGGESGPAIVKGDPGKSRLVQALRHDGDLKMPPKQKLPAEAIEALTTWVRMGAPWPKSDRTVDRPDAWKKHWAFQPVRKPTLPSVKDAGAAATSIDRFVVARLEARGWSPAPLADRRTLARRVTFDLTGLPPTPAEVDAFVNDTSAAAYEKLVDRLLASPHFGERWGRYWLDLARYADERGYVGVNVDRVYPFAYAYRDWVIRALNEDLPYDRFVIDQLAADQVVSGPDTRDLAGMGFLTVGRRFLNNTHDVIDDRIDVICRGLLGLTVTCARCHDHKFDPIPTRDYYSLYGVFASSREPDEMPLLEPSPTGPDRDAFQQELQKLEAEKAKFERDNAAMKSDQPRDYVEKIKPFENKMKKLLAAHPGAPPRGMVMVDRPQPETPRVFVRGNPNNRGATVPRQFLAVLTGERRQPFQKGSGRLELARAIASKDNPLTARVMVNRVWLHLFGAGLVRTPSDFGLRSEPPSHPELLDYLAGGFVEGGWSVKQLVRTILLSRTYQQASNGNLEYAQADPDNVWLWRMNRRRLDFEALRDSLLATSGQLDRALGGRSVSLTAQPASRRRTVYGFIDRQNLPGVFRTFDFASPDTHSPQRFTTTVPQQALYLMNSPFAVEQARHLAARTEVAAGPTDQRLGQLYRIVLGRTPSDVERQRAMRFVQEAGAEKIGADSLNPWEQLAQTLLMANEFVFLD